MWIFIRGIPKEMDAKALEKYIRRLLLPGWFPFSMIGRVRVSGSKILKVVHTRTRAIEYHGLIQVQPASKVESVIERINQARIKGRKLHAHPYSKRYPRGDRRDAFHDEGVNPRADRRSLERRRKHLVTQVIDASL